MKIKSIFKNKKVLVAMVLAGVLATSGLTFAWFTQWLGVNSTVQMGRIELTLDQITSDSTVADTNGTMTADQIGYLADPTVDRYVPGDAPIFGYVLSIHNEDGLSIPTWLQVGAPDGVYNKYATLDTTTTYPSDIQPNAFPYAPDPLPTTPTDTGTIQDAVNAGIIQYGPILNSQPDLVTSADDYFMNCMTDGFFWFFYQDTSTQAITWYLGINPPATGDVASIPMFMGLAFSGPNMDNSFQGSIWNLGNSDPTNPSGWLAVQMGGNSDPALQQYYGLPTGAGDLTLALGAVPADYVMGGGLHAMSAPVIDGLQTTVANVSGMNLYVAHFASYSDILAFMNAYGK
jgi:hypothetical protein